MAEQHLSVGAINAGGSVTVQPVQIFNSVPDAATRGWIDALLRGPLEHARLADKAKEAQRLEEDGNAAEAAALFDTIAIELGRSGYGPASRRYLAQASRLYAASGDRPSARALELKLCLDVLGDGTPSATTHARRAIELSESDEVWEGEALLVVASWPESHPNELEVLDRARERSIGLSDELRWAARIVDHLRRSGTDPRAKEIAQEAIGDRALEAGARLDLELDLIDLLGDDHPGQDQRLELLRGWLLDPTLPIPEAGRAWQRCGVALARRGDSDGARTAFLRAVDTWSRHPSYDDQVAASYFSGLTARAALGDRSAYFDEGRTLASDLRGSEDTAHRRIEMLLRRGLSALVVDKPNVSDAWWAFSAAVDEARRAGNLSDFFTANRYLGDCLAFAGHAGLALGAYISAGETTKAHTLTGASSADAVLDAVVLDGPRWERAASWAALAGAGTIVSDRVADRLAAAALAETAREPASGGPPNAAWYALEVLGNVACAIQGDELLQRAVPLLADRMTCLMGKPSDLPIPLIRLTLIGRFDATSILVDAFLDPNVHISISPGTLADLLDDRPNERRRLVDAAVAGEGQALDVIAFTQNGFAESEPLHAVAEARVREVIGAEPMKLVTEDDGSVSRVQGIGSSLAAEGVYARACDTILREHFVDAILALVADTNVSLLTRVGAVEALHNLGQSLPSSRAEAVAQALQPLAVNPDVLAVGDRLDHDEPLARFKVNLAPDDALRGAAIDALGRLGEDHPACAAVLAGAIEPALLSQSEPLVRAATIALSRHLQMSPPSLNVSSLLAAPWESVRLAALGVLEEMNPKFAVTAAQQLLSDPTSYVRRNLIGLAERAGDDGRPLLGALADDADAYIRASARVRLRT